jgi:sulfite exporter TauE/SafE
VLPVVYATLFYAMLSGSWLGGALMMLGFGLGTLPALVGTGLGILLLRRWATSVWLPNTVGLAILMLGIMSAIMPAATMA